jgi:membrane-associated phospholipid phosphatase
VRALRGKALRAAAWATVCAGLALPLTRRQTGLRPGLAAAASAAGPFGLAVAVPRSRRRDAAVYALQMWAYIVLHELPYEQPGKLERRVLVDYPITFDEKVFGMQPNVALQRALAKDGQPRALDYGLAFAHWAWFLQPHAAVAWILWRHPERFPRAATSLCAVFDLGLIGYFAAPTAPPWWAAEKGRITGLRRIMEEVGRRVWGRFWTPLYGFLGGNPLAAMPSLHFATSVMAAHELRETGGLPAVLGWSYAATLGFALVYLGEHYVLDLLAGLALTEAVRAGRPAVAPLFAQVERTVSRLELHVRHA